MKRYLILYFVISFFALISPLITLGQGALDKVIAPLEEWADNHPQEKVYVHLDKPYYIAGDTIWLKAYTVVGSQHMLSALSGALYLDLINESDSLITAIKLPLISGMAKGNIDLPDDLDQGNYRIRSYTQWMRNAGPDYFYDQSFVIGSILKRVVEPKVSFNYETDKGKVNVNTTLSFLNADSKPLVGNQVNYRVQTSTDLLQSGKAKTDNSGNINISLKTPDD